MTTHGDQQWYEEDTGHPAVRPYAMTRGRTRSSKRLDLLAMVAAVPRPEGEGEPADHTLSPEHLEILDLCRSGAMTVAEIAAESGLLLGVVRVFVGDLMTAELVRVSPPVPQAQLPDEGVLREVIDGLRAL